MNYQTVTPDLKRNNKGRTIIFPGGGGHRDFQEAGNFFYHRLSACKYFSSTHCGDIFF